MKVTADPRRLAHAAAWAARHTLPVGGGGHPALSCLHLRADGDRLVVTATDAAVWARAELPATVHEPGETLLGAEVLAGLLARSPDDQTLELVTEGAATLTCGSLCAVIPTIPARDHPAGNGTANPTAALPPAVGAVDAKALRVAVERVKVALAKDRDASGIALDGFTALPGERLRIAASDRHRFTLATLAWTPAAAGGHAPIVAHARLLTEIPDGVETDVTLHAGERLVGVSWPGGALVAPATTGEPIQVDRLLKVHLGPGPGEKRWATVDRQALEDALRQAAQVAPRADVSRGIAPAVTVDLAGGELRLAAASDAGRVRSTVPADYDGPDLHMMVNWHYAKDAVAKAGGDQVTLAPGFADQRGTRSLLVTRAGDEDYLHVVMGVNPERAT